MYKQIIRLENKKYFPIIISNTRGTLNQALLYTLQKSLNNEGIDNLTVDNDFIQVESNNGKSIGADIFDRGVCLPSDIKNTDEEMERGIQLVKTLFR